MRKGIWIFLGIAVYKVLHSRDQNKTEYILIDIPPLRIPLSLLRALGITTGEVKENLPTISASLDPPGIRFSILGHTLFVKKLGTKDIADLAVSYLRGNVRKIKVYEDPPYLVISIPRIKIPKRLVLPPT